jgi:hypothetical protein
MSLSSATATVTDSLNKLCFKPLVNPDEVHMLNKYPKKNSIHRKEKRLFHKFEMTRVAWRIDASTMGATPFSTVLHRPYHSEHKLTVKSLSMILPPQSITVELEISGVHGPGRTGPQQ